MIYALKGDLRQAWKIKYGTKNPAASWIVFIDKESGKIIEERNVIKKINGKGKVFRPNPVVSLNRDDLYDQQDEDQNIFNKAYRTISLKELNSGGYLKGPYVDSGTTSGRAQSPNYQFTSTHIVGR
jgi:hypothetical protein